MIGKPFVEAWRYLKKHPKILVPKFIYLAITVYIGFLLQKHFKIFEAFFESEVVDPLLVPAQATNSLIYLGLYGLFLFILGVCFSAVIYGLISDILNKNKCLLSTCKAHLKAFFKPVLILRLWMGVVYAIAAILSLIPSMLLSALGVANVSLPAFLITASGLYLLISFGFFFRYPILILENKKPREALRESYYFFKREPRYVILCALALVLVSFLATFLNGFIATINVFVFQAVSFLVNIIVGIWADIFLFSAYHFRTKKKKK
ncbi:MAG: hypothetical protein Q8R00_03110 [Candidatus Nanoarchaeia archaeon]|nr:hypothetical protein [Candidatus Nanoarchaeia archaeon]